MPPEITPKLAQRRIPAVSKLFSNRINCRTLQAAPNKPASFHPSKCDWPGCRLAKQFPCALNHRYVQSLFEKDWKLFAQHDFSSVIHSCACAGKSTWTTARLLLLFSLHACNGTHVLNAITAVRRYTIARQHNIYFGFLVVSLMNSFKIHSCPYIIIGFSIYHSWTPCYLFFLLCTVPHGLRFWLEYMCVRCWQETCLPFR